MMKFNRAQRAAWPKTTLTALGKDLTIQDSQRTLKVKKMETKKL